MGDFGFKYAKTSPTKDCENNPVKINKCNRQQDNNDIVNSVSDEILLNENQKVSAEKGSHESIVYNFDESELYHINKMSLDDTKEKLK